MRFSLNSFPFHRINMCPMMGFYDEEEKGQFLSNANNVNLDYDAERRQISFDVLSEELRNKIALVTDFTIAPIILCVCDGNEHINRGISAEDVEEAETVKALFNNRLPIVFECKMQNHEGIHYEAHVSKVSASDMVLDTDGNLDLSIMLSEMMLICD